MVRFLRLLVAARRPPVVLTDGGTYRFRRYPDDGELFRLDGARLVNLTYPGRNLAVGEDGAIYAVALTRVGSTDDLVPAVA